VRLSVKLTVDLQKQSLSLLLLDSYGCRVDDGKGKLNASQVDRSQFSLLSACDVKVIQRQRKFQKILRANARPSTHSVLLQLFESKSRSRFGCVESSLYSLFS